MTHIFGVGLNKTGTKSVAAALELLGYSATHWGCDEEIRRAESEGAPLLTYAPQTDAYIDLRTVERWFDRLDVQYPGSRFILTTRSLDPWMDSREAHVRRNLARPEGERKPWQTIDRERWAGLYEDHHRRVFDYFNGRDDLLVMDVTAGDGWSKLAPFLGHDTPALPFPLEGRTTVRRRLATRRRLLLRWLGL